MEKKMKDINLDYPLKWIERVEISTIKKDIEELEKLGATHIDIDYEICCDCTYININAICQRLETDQEFEQRQKEIQIQKDWKLKRELQQLAELKAKYEH